MGFALVYDSDCGPCTAFSNVVGFLDPAHRMTYLGLAEADRKGMLAGIPGAMRWRSFHLVSENGEALSGNAAIATLVSQLPGGRLPSAAIRSNPLVSRGVRFAYNVLSRLHDTGSCST